MIASSEVASARSCGSDMKIARAGTNRMPPPTPSSPPTPPPANPSRAASTYSIRASRDDELDCDRKQEQREQAGDDPLGQALLKSRSGDDAQDRRGPHEQRIARVDVPVGRLNGRRDR